MLNNSRGASIRLRTLASILTILVLGFGLIGFPGLALASTMGPKAVQVTVQEDIGDRIVLDYSFDAFTEEDVIIDGQTFTQIRLGKESLMKEVIGAPELPQVNRSIIIPNDATMEAALIDGDYYDVRDVDIVPSRGFILRKVNPADVPYEFGDVYQKDAFYPSKPFALGNPYILRDYRGMVVHLYPFQYNPVQRTLRVYTRMTIEIFKARAGKINVKTRPFRPEDVSRAFYRIYRNHFINYGSPSRFSGTESRYTPLGETGDMLIICNDAWLSNMQSFVDHKNNNMDINTRIVGVSTIGNNSTSIKNYIQNAYNTGNLAFVLLVGDSDTVATPTASGGSSDPTYSKLAGSDDYPDILVGRFSAQSAANVDTQVQRTIEYELLPATTQTWFKKGIGIASSEGPGHNNEYDYQHMNNIRTDLLNDGYTTVDQIYDPSGTAAQVSTAVNAGRGIINYCGHGSSTSWVSSGFSVTNVNALTNNSKLPFIFDVACVNGQFAGITCFAEAWMRATNGTAPTGAIGIYASSINQSWSPPMDAQDEMNDLLVAEAYFSFGGICYAGSCKMMDLNGSGGVEMFNTWHVFGDPSVRIVGTAAPQSGLGVTPTGGFIASGNVGGPFSPSSMSFTLQNLGSSSINYSISKTKTWLTLSSTSGTLTGYQSKTITVSINTGANSLSGGSYSDTITFTNTTNGQGNTTRPVTLSVSVPSQIDTPREYETNDGMLISWRSYTTVLASMVQKVTTLDPTAMVYIAVTGSSEQSSATSTLNSYGVDMSQVAFLTYTSDTVWARDYGPRFIYDGSTPKVLDYVYNRPRPSDDAFPPYISNQWQETLVSSSLVQGDGNFHVMGNDAFMTDLVLAENTSYTAQQMKDLIQQLMNLNLTIYPRFPSSFDATGHVDMWMLPVSNTKVIIGQYASSTGTPYTVTENAVSDLVSRGYTVVRTPGWNTSGVHYTYTNAVVMNDVVLIPKYGHSNDSVALSVFQNAFPDRSIQQIDCSSIIQAAGALHCIVKHVPEGSGPGGGSSGYTPTGTVFSSTDTPLSIPDNNTTGITSQIFVNQSVNITDININLNISHTYIGDLQVKLTSPSTTTVLIHNRTGASADDIIAWYDPEATPAESLSTFNNTNAYGYWTLTVIDAASADVGTLNNWKIEVNGQRNRQY